jgi:phospholipase C
MNRRNFLRAGAAGAALASLPLSIQRALAIPANNRTGTINDVEHIVIFMLENRGFNHYFGTLPGVRGFSDRITIPMASGNPVWIQQGSAGTVQPYHLDPSKGDALVDGGAHGWGDQHNAWDHGRMAAWPRAKGTSVSMGYLTEDEIPFHWALANSFTVCDGYYCSLLGPTRPNRMFLWSGTNGAAVGQPLTGNDTWWDLTWAGANAAGSGNIGATWKTYPERLQEAGVSWKVYNCPISSSTNDGDDPMTTFLSVRQANAALTAQGFPYTAAYSPQIEALSPLFKAYGNTMPDNGFLQAVADDVAAGTLPQVSWVVSPSAYCEHPGSSSPANGSWYIQKLLDILTSNPDTWSKTVFFIMYDENDCFFDQVPPPCPPSPNGDGTHAGKSTVDTTYDYVTGEPPYGGNSFAANGAAVGDVVGPCVRVPMLVVSPWSAGGWVNSQVYDHTSVLRFVEQRFGVAETNITPWRRTVFGDMTTCFDFKNPSAGVPNVYPALDQATVNALQNQQAASAAVPVPATGSVPLPSQPLAARPSRALPYHLHTSANVDAGGGQVWLTFSNTGEQGAVFHVYDKLHLDKIPRRYTVEGGKMISDSWNAAANSPSGQYSLWVLGPNGFHRSFDGNTAAVASGPNPEIRVCYDAPNNSVYLTIMNAGNATATLTVAANAYRSDGPWTYTVDAGMQIEPSWNLDGSSGWYDFTLTMDGGYTRRYAGRLETGKDGVSDPAMGVQQG